MQFERCVGQEVEAEEESVELRSAEAVDEAERKRMVEEGCRKTKKPLDVGKGV